MRSLRILALLMISSAALGQSVSSGGVKPGNCPIAISSVSKSSVPLCTPSLHFLNGLEFNDTVPQAPIRGSLLFASGAFPRWTQLQMPPNAGGMVLHGGIEPHYGVITAADLGPGLLAANNNYSGSNLYTGINTFLGLVNCKNIESSIICVDTANTQGWAGTDPGAWINSAITALPSTGGQLLIASGQYSVTTPITGAQDATILCPTGGATGSTSSLNFTPATGTLITWSNSAFQLIGCTLTTTTSTSSVGLKLSQVNYTTNIERNHINGFFGGMLVTGNGTSTYSTGVHITNNLIDGINANCGGGAGYGISIDHARDVTYDKNQIYSVTDCATGIPMILDTGVGGIWLGGSTFEQGLHAGIIRNTNQGGTYGSAPAAIWGEGITWDLSPGGDALLFDSTLGTSDIRFFCTACWAAGAGKNVAGTVITAAAVGFNVQGGANIHFTGGTSRINASWGALVGTSGTNISFEGVNVHSNNQGNTAGVGGIKIAGPTGWRLVNNRSGNIIEGGGNQAWGIDLSGASTNGVLSGNDLRNNTSGRINYPAGIAQAGVDAPEFGSGTGLHFYGPTMWLEQPAPSAVAGEEVCGGDSTAHTLKCSYNNGAFGTVPLINTAWTWTDKQTFGGNGASNAAINISSQTAPTSPVAGDIWQDTNEEKHVVQTSTAGAVKLYDSGGTNAVTITPNGSVTAYTLSVPAVAPIVAGSGLSCAVAGTCVWAPNPSVLTVAADFVTAANTNLQLITGLTYTLPANKATVSKWNCDLYYNQQTAAAADAFGVQDVSVAPTQIMGGGFVQTAATTWVDTAMAATITSTTATNIVAMTPSAITTIWHAHLDFTVEQPSNASTSAIQVQAKTGTSADTLTVKRGSSCLVNFQ